jgi:hypothetical protein
VIGGQGKRYRQQAGKCPTRQAKCEYLASIEATTFGAEPVVAHMRNADHIDLPIIFGLEPGPFEPARIRIKCEYIVH